MNPYVSLLSESLAGQGVACTTSAGLSPRIVGTWTRPTHVVHLHWPEMLYASPSMARGVRLLAAVALALLRSRAMGTRIVWTVHNVRPHEQGASVLDQLARRLLLALVDAYHVHDEQARGDMIRAGVQPERVHVIPHGSYLGAYPDDCTRDQARERLGLTQQSFVYLFLGQIRRYKGVEELVAAFKKLGSGAELIIAGNVHDQEYARQVEAEIAGCAGIKQHFRYVPDDELQYLMRAADVCVFPYRDITTSGAAILAFSFGRPIVAPLIGAFPALVQDGRGIGYDARAEDGLLEGLLAAQRLDLAHASARARQWAEEHRWPSIAPRFVAMYEAAMSGGQS